MFAKDHYIFEKFKEEQAENFASMLNLMRFEGGDYWLIILRKENFLFWEPPAASVYWRQCMRVKHAVLTLKERTKKCLIKIRTNKINKSKIITIKVSLEKDLKKQKKRAAKAVKALIKNLPLLMTLHETDALDESYCQLWI